MSASALRAKLRALECEEAAGGQEGSCAAAAADATSSSAPLPPQPPRLTPLTDAELTDLEADVRAREEAVHGLAEAVARRERSVAERLAAAATLRGELEDELRRQGASTRLLQAMATPERAEGPGYDSALGGSTGGVSVWCQACGEGRGEPAATSTAADAAAAANRRRKQHALEGRGAAVRRLERAARTGLLREAACARAEGRLALVAGSVAALGEAKEEEARHEAWLALREKENEALRARYAASRAALLELHSGVLRATQTHESARVQRTLARPRAAGMAVTGVPDEAFEASLPAAEAVFEAAPPPTLPALLAVGAAGAAEGGGAAVVAALHNPLSPDAEASIQDLVLLRRRRIAALVEAAQGLNARAETWRTLLEHHEAITTNLNKRYQALQEGERRYLERRRTGPPEAGV